MTRLTPEEVFDVVVKDDKEEILRKFGDVGFQGTKKFFLYAFRILLTKYNFDVGKIPNDAIKEIYNDAKNAGTNQYY